MERSWTPPPQPTAVSATPESVPRLRQTSVHLCPTGDLTYGRQDVLRDIQDIGQVPFSYLKDAILPPLPSKVDIDKIKSSLGASKQLTPTGRWAAFSVDPSAGTDKADVVFECLLEVFSAIIKEARESTNRTATLKMISSPSVAPQSGGGSPSRPDAYLLMVDAKKKSVSLRSSPNVTRDSWDDIAASFEFKKGESETDQRINDQNIIRNLHYVMRNDPCRRATFGITIENSNMRVWFTCRSMTLVSEPFNFVTNVEDTIYLFCCLAFAEDHELGWDTTIERVLYKKAIQYRITINGTVYQTVDIISDFGAEAMRGRGTRVFKAYSLADGEERRVVAVKDAWRYAGQRREDEILRDILADIKATGGDHAEIAARQHFLTVLNQDDVKIEGVMDDTQQLLRGKELPDPMSWYKVSLDAFQDPDSQKIHHKQHFRLVFDEIGQPVFALQSLCDVIRTLDGAMKGLWYMHTAGWIHRDISSANVLQYKDRGLIVDLEYAKRMTSGENDGGRKGTVDFMACEVESQEYHFLPSTPIPNCAFSPATPSIRQSRQAVLANPLHDLESVWWVLIWVLHNHMDAEARDPAPMQAAVYRNYFPRNRPEESGRLRAVCLLLCLNASVFPPTFFPAVMAADGMRECLLVSYGRAEMTLGPSGLDVSDLHLECSRTFTKMLKELYDYLKSSRDIRLLPLPAVRSNI
ncbi:hypothetical protein BU15DRAFT_73701 [Melanogaster broomeanus]|nr:hypothetical protein BU15DRAFT_73701 [Melanogaster broomeanus]